MGQYTVEIRTGLLTGSNIVHTWLHVTRADGGTEAYGFHPLEDSAGNVLYGPGDVQEESASKRYTGTSGPLTISETQYQALKSAINDADISPPNYSLLAWSGGGHSMQHVVSADAS